MEKDLDKDKRKELLIKLNVSLQQAKSVTANLKDKQEIEDMKNAVVSLEVENKELKSESEIKDKIIDEMAIYLADIDFDECCAEIPEPCLGCSWEDYEPHTNCIKEYFKRKVENGTKE